MSQSESHFRPDVVELFAGDALGELDAIERQRLAEQSSDQSQQVSEQLHLTAAAVQLAFASRDLEPMPATLRNRIASDAMNHLPQLGTANPVQPLVKDTQASYVPWRERIAWFVTAASLLFAVGIWALNRQTTGITALNAVQARTELLSQVEDGINIAWTKGTAPFDIEVTGDVVWSNKRQQGFLRFVGMPINDPAIEQYQLWIIDPLRDDEPIDGGVFDVTSDGEVIIPIDARLPVISPAAFAVTIEKPGGVVVSDQKRLPLLAKVPESKG